MEIFPLELMFPRFCLGCGYIGMYICADCEKRMKRMEKSSCIYCGSASLLGLTHPACKRKLGIDGSLSTYSYSGLFKRILHESKYKGAFSILDNLLDYSLTHKNEIILNWKKLFFPTLVPVPLHHNRLLERGFNQSDLIAYRHASRFGLRRLNVLTRTNDTPHLAGISGAAKRKRAIKGSFTYAGDEVPRCAVLVDDVITTGSTLSECASVLKKAGVQVVLTISLAKG